jgi:hypothetical protein
MRGKSAAMQVESPAPPAGFEPATCGLEVLPRAVDCALQSPIYVD